MANNRATEIPDYAIAALATIRTHAARVNVSPRIDAKLYTAFGYVWVSLDSAEWLDSLLWLLDECERDGATVGAIDARTDVKAIWLWRAPGWAVRADLKRAEALGETRTLDLDVATGAALDALARLFGVSRESSQAFPGYAESDASLRRRAREAGRPNR